MPPSLDLSFLRSRAVLKRVAAVTLVCAALGVLYAVIAPNWYRSVLTVVPRTPQKQGISGLLGAAGGLAAGLEPALGGSAETPRIAAVLQSVVVSDAVIEALDLRTRYGARNQEGARDALWDHCAVKAVPKPNLVQLSCEDKDPRFAQRMLAVLAENGNQVFRRIGESSASEEVRFLEKRVAELRLQAEGAATRMQEFQEKHKIVDLDTQAKALVSTLATLHGQRITKQLELDLARTYSAHDSVTLKELQSQLSVLGQTLRDLEEDPPAGIDTAKTGRRESAASGVLPPALAVPRLRAEFETLLRDRKVIEATLVFALERLEGARAEEARATSTFLVLDPATLPTRKSRPQRLFIVAACALFGLLASAVFEWWRAGGAAALRGSAESKQWPPSGPGRSATRTG